MEASISRAICLESSLLKFLLLSVRNVMGWVMFFVFIFLNIFCVDLVVVINVMRLVICVFIAGVAFLNNSFAFNRAMIKIMFLFVCGLLVCFYIGGVVVIMLYLLIGKYDFDFRYVNDVGGVSVGCFFNLFMRLFVRICYIFFFFLVLVVIMLFSDCFFVNNVFL